MFSFARVQVLLNVARSSPSTLFVDLEGEDSVEVEVQYESIPCSKCLSAGHLSIKCPFKMKPGLMKTPTQATVLVATLTSQDFGPDDGDSHQASPTIEVSAFSIPGVDQVIFPNEQGNHNDQVI
ncbi:hypothetical protein MRB53_016734 [Persea americana]|uniref:Uncharacterized protein n=1 Tax=Persea americana TaxID=3435 RepID=A0ACC2M330_PERAE|nr:hypothetical protein MRB53_016734 [Persea americana]